MNKLSDQKYSLFFDALSKIDLLFHDNFKKLSKGVRILQKDLITINYKIIIDYYKNPYLYLITKYSLEESVKKIYEIKINNRVFYEEESSLLKSSN